MGITRWVGRFRRAALLCAAVTFFAGAASAQVPWRPMGVLSQAEYDQGMIGGEGEQHMQGIARSRSNPDVLYMAHDCAHLWRSGDNGLSWQRPSCEGLDVQAGESIEVDPLNPDRVFALVDNAYNYLLNNFRGLYRSTDGGETWTLVLQEDLAHVRCDQHRIAYDPASVSGGMAQRWYVAGADNAPGTGYTANNDAAIYRSDDGGDTWIKGASLVGHDWPAVIYCHPTDGQTLYVASDEGLLVSHDRGATLAPLGNLPSGRVSGLAVNPQSPNDVWAVVLHVGLYRSTDAGQTFSLVRSSSAAYHVVVNEGYGNVVYFVPEWGESQVSLNSGQTWTTSNTIPRPSLSSGWKHDFSGALAGVSPDPRTAFGAVGYAKAAFFRTADGGATWTDSSNGFTGYAWGWGSNDISWDVADPNRWIMFCYDVGPQMTRNNADWFTSHSVPYTWYQQGLIQWIGTYSGQIQPVAGSQTIIASVGNYFNNRLMRSTDGGATWTLTTTRTDTYWYVGFHPNEPKLAWAGPLRSTDAGASWQEMTTLTSLNSGAEVLGYAPSHPDTLYAIAAGYGQLFRSDDRGLTWRTYCDTSWSFSRMDSRPTAVIDPADEDTVYTLDNRGDLARFDGTTWTSLGVLDAAGGPGPQGNCVRTVAVDPRHPEVIYAAMLMPGGPIVLRTTDAGQNWQDITSNLSRSGGPSLQVNPYTGDLLQGSTYGTWVYPPPYASPDALYYKLAGAATIVGWETLADHGPAGEVAVAVDDGATECRLAGLGKLRLTFDGPLDPATVTPGAVTVTGEQGGDLTSRIASLTLDDDCIELTVTFDAPLPDADTYHVAVTDQVRMPDGDPVAGDRELVLRVLAGDVDGSGSVTAADVLAVRSGAGQSAVDGAVMLDVDGSATVTAADMLAVRRRMGATLP